jgi:hypothetical protein
VEILYNFLLGVLATCAAAIGLFFVRFWRTSRDRLFLWFAAGFALLGASWAAVAAQPVWRRPEAEAWWQVYLLRLAAYVVIIWGVVEKNRGRPRGDQVASGHMANSK